MVLRCWSKSQAHRDAQKNLITLIEGISCWYILTTVSLMKYLIIFIKSSLGYLKNINSTIMQNNYIKLIIPALVLHSIFTISH